MMKSTTSLQAILILQMTVHTNFHLLSMVGKNVPFNIASFLAKTAWFILNTEKKDIALVRLHTKFEALLE